MDISLEALLVLFDCTRWYYRIGMSFVCYSVFESQLGCEVNNASTLEKALDAFTKSSMAGEVQ